MKTTTSSNENVILGLTAFLIAAFVCFFFAFQTKEQKVSQSESHNINYEMAKAKSSENLYNLDGREIDRDSQELENVEPSAIKSALAKNDKSIVKSKKTADKKTDAKKSQAAAAAAQAAKTVSKKSDQIKSHYTVQDAELKLDAKTDSNLKSNVQPARAVSNAETAPVATDKKNEIPKIVKSIQQWTTEILASADRQIVLQFVAAYKNKEVTEPEFYSVINQLLTNSDEAKKGFGLYALRATPSYASYATLIKTQSTQNASYQAYIQDTLLTYNQTGSLNYLRQALNSTDKAVVLKTLEIIKTGVTDVKNGTTSALIDSRYRRDTGATTFAVQSYLAFLPQLTLLQNQSQQSGDQDVFIAAQQLTQTIQSTAVIAAN